MLSVAVSAGSFSTQPVILINPPARPEVCYCLFQAQQAVSWEKLIFIKFTTQPVITGNITIVCRLPRMMFFVDANFKI